MPITKCRTASLLPLYQRDRAVVCTIDGFALVLFFAGVFFRQRNKIGKEKERSGLVGEVNISQNTYELLKDHSEFTFESRGKIEAKGKGEIEMYFVKFKTPE